MPICVRLVLFAAACLGLACQSNPPAAPALARGATGALARPWTRAFQREAVIIADEIQIEGPSDLIDHLALRQDDETRYHTKTVPEGLRQELVPGPDSTREVRGQIDAWSLAAFRRIVVLQRPFDVPVRVRAVGNAYFAWSDGSGEQRQDELQFQGTRGP